MQVNIIPFEWYHVDAMDLRDQERAFFALVPTFRNHLKMQKHAGPAYSAVTPEDGVVCSWGFAQIWPGVVECWLITSRTIDRSFGAKRRLLDVGRQIMDDVEIGLQAHRLQMHINPQFTYAIRYAEALYFTQESVLKAYGPDGSDYLLFTRINHGQSIRRR